VLAKDLAVKMVNVWLDSTYEAGRHQRRLDKISRLEEDVRAGKF
jgi:ribose 5-phosphate isomerase B